MIKLHDTFSYTTVFTQEDVETFATLSGDRNPMHVDPEFAKKGEFGRQIVQGMLILCAFSKVYGTQFPGPDSLFISQEVTFLKPVFVGEEYTIKFECVAIDGQRSIGTIASVLKDKEGSDLLKVTSRIKSSSQFSISYHP